MKQFFLLVTLSSLLVTFSACSSSDTAPSTPTATADTGLSSFTTLQTVELVVGTGTTATAGRSISVHYTGWLYKASAVDSKGTKFDSSVDRGTPFSFTLGAGQVIAGWDQGIAGMRVGGQRRLIIPPSLAYGSRGQGSIPANATLVFDVQLLAVN